VTVAGSRGFGTAALGIVVAGHFVTHAALWRTQSQRFCTKRFDLHRESRADARERKDHEADQSAVAKSYGPGHVNAVEQRAAPAA
jgi:hypothetical protein